MTQLIKRIHWRVGIVVLALLGLLASDRVPVAFADHCSRGQGTLSGPAINGVAPTGKAEWQGNAFCQPLEFRVEVSKVNLPDGTTLAVDACGSAGSQNIVGTITLRGGSGKLQLSKLDGNPANDNVPFCDMRFGGTVRVLRGDTAVVSGCVSSKDIPGAPAC
jgi:hypothetical protein